MDRTDQQLLHDYQRTGEAQALQTLIRRHLDMVYSAAVRQVRDRHLAEDVTQAVFILFARKARSLSPSVVLAGWLFRTTRNVAINAMRKEARRQRHEQLAAASRAQETHASAPSHTIESSDELRWEEVAPRVDEAMSRLRTSYRDALVLRFLRGLSLAQVGQALGVTEEAARKLVSRGIAQLRGRLASSSSPSHLSCSEAALIAALSARALESAPQHLVQAVTAIATQGAAATAATASSLSLAKGTLIMMSSAKIKSAIIAVAVALCLLGGGVAAVTYVIGSSEEVIMADPTPAAPAPAVAPMHMTALSAGPTPAPEPVAVEVRQAIIAMLDAIRRGDIAKVSAGMIVEQGEYQPVADAGEAITRNGIRLRQALAARFGAVPEEMDSFLPGGQKALREQFLPTAPVQMDGDTAIVSLPPNSVPPNMLLRKTDGQWKLLTGGSFLSGEQKDPQKIAASLTAVAEAYQQVTADLEAGHCQSVPETISRLQARMQPGMAQ